MIRKTDTFKKAKWYHLWNQVDSKMGKKEKLYQKAMNSPTNLKFEELCKLAESYGFKFRNQSGSHRIYKHPEHRQLMNFQPDKRDPGKAKVVQIRQLLSAIDDLGLR